MTNKPLTFIDLLDETGRTSSLAVYGRRADKAEKLTSVGGLNHNLAFEPKSVNDAKKLINWLNEWIDKTGTK